MTARSTNRHTFRWIRPVSILALAWNLFGLSQFTTTTFASRDGLLAAGLTAAQADLYLALPFWMTAAFAVGVGGGLLGSLALLMKRRSARTIFAGSAAGYVALFVGDLVEGVFAAFGPPQVAILTVVVAIAGGLLWAARAAVRAQVLA